MIKTEVEVTRTKDKHFRNVSIVSCNVDMSDMSLSPPKTGNA